MRKIAAPILFRSLSSLVFLGAMAGCVAAPAPYDEYSLARSAVRAAQEFDSARFATGLWNKAEENYHNGQKAFKEAEFDRAKKYFVAAQQYAEKAENATRLKKFQSGDSFP
jgi:hypothetical protein